MISIRLRMKQSKESTLHIIKWNWLALRTCRVSAVRKKSQLMTVLNNNLSQQRDQINAKYFQMFLLWNEYLGIEMLTYCWALIF